MTKLLDTCDALVCKAKTAFKRIIKLVNYMIQKQQMNEQQQLFTAF